VINGSKCFITNSGTDITRAVTVTAVTGQKADGGKGDLLDHRASGTPGFTVSKKYSKVGWNASDTRELSFSDVRVPAANLLGERGPRLRQFLRILDEGRIAIAALGVAGRAASTRACATSRSARPSAQDRHVPGHPVQSIADMETRAHTARLAYTTPPTRCCAASRFKREASIAKLVSSNAAMDNSRGTPTQIFGGYGFMNEYPSAGSTGRQDPGGRRGHQRGPAHASSP